MDIVKELVRRLQANEELTESKVAELFGISRWQASKYLFTAKYLANKFNQVYMHKPEKPRQFKNEKQTYAYVKDTLFEVAFKVYSPVLKGLPDFLVVVPKHEVLKAGFYEVKIKGRKLSKEQERLMGILSLSFNTYLVEVCKNTGTIEVYYFGG